MKKIILDLLANTNHENIIKTNIIPWSSPVPVFGDLLFSEIATLGLNPSNREFVDSDNKELSGKLRRFHTLESLKLSDWSRIDDERISRVLESYKYYFDNNPYDTWFKYLDYLISDTGCSYYSNINKACHLDLVPFATYKKWGNLSSQEKEILLKDYGYVLVELLKHSKIKFLVLNGQSVVNEFQKVLNKKLESQEMPNWQLPRKSGKPVKGYCYFGKIDSISGNSLGREILVLGFNHNIQSSFGVTLKTKSSIKVWIGSCFKEEFS